MDKSDALPAAVKEAIKLCSRYAKTTPDYLEDAFQRKASPALQEGPMAARHLLEQCVYWALHTLGKATVRASFQDSAFRKATFSFMLAWEAAVPTAIPPPSSLKERGSGPSVSQAAFRRIAPAIAGAANVVTAQALFDSLAKNTSDLYFSTWDKYLLTLAKTEQQLEKQAAALSKSLDLQPGEVVLAEAGASLDKWADGGSGHGHLTLTDRAIYFQGDFRRFVGPRPPVQRMDLASDGHQDVQSQRVGPMGTRMFDRALTVSSDEWPEPWVLDFLEYSGHRQRDCWQAMIGEVLAAHDFVREYEPPADDEDASCASLAAATRGASTALQLAVEGIAALQACQAVLGTPPPHPERLLQFFWAAKIPEGHLVEQALAVELWGERPAPVGFIGTISTALGLSIAESEQKGRCAEGGSEEEGEEGEEEEEEGGGEGEGEGEGEARQGGSVRLRDRLRRRRGRRRENIKHLVKRGHGTSAGRLPAVGTSGVVFQEQWMDSPTWKTDESLSFWREKAEDGLWVGGPLLVGGQTKLEEAVQVGRAQESLAERAQASIDGALIEGIPKNIDLLKELLYPVIIVVKFILVKAPTWDSPPITIITGLGLLFLINSKYLWLMPSVGLLGVALVALFLRWTRRSAASQPVLVLTRKPSGAVKKILKLKEVLDAVTATLQAVNIALLKCRTLLLSDSPEATDKVLLAMLALALALLVLAWIPLRLLCTLLVLHVFTAKMSFRQSKGSRQTLGRKLKRWWDTLPVASVTMVILEPEEWDREVKGMPMESLDKEAIIHRLGKDNLLGDTSEMVEVLSVGESKTRSPGLVRRALANNQRVAKDGIEKPRLDKELSNSMKVVASFIEEHNGVD